jgi:hypothetical protein
MDCRPRARVTQLDAGLALLSPCLALLTFPHRFPRPHNPLHAILQRLVPRYDWDPLPTGCMGTPYGPVNEVRVELLFDLVGDFSVFTSAMIGLCLLVTTLTSVQIGRAGRPPQLALWTLIVTVLSVLAWAEFGRAVLAAT